MRTIHNRAKQKPAIPLRVDPVRASSASRLGLWAAVLGLCLVALAGCLEDTINNQIVAPGGAIFGRVTPVEAGTEVAAWQATKVKSVVVDAKGFFTITDLKPGLYDVIVTASSGAHRMIHDVEVDLTQSTSLGTIALIDLPSPLLGFGPGNGDSSVAISNAVVYLFSEVPLDVGSLETAVQITPPIAGAWSQEYYPAEAYLYDLRAQGTLQTGTTYSVHVGPSLRLASGSTWGSTFDFSFTTEVFSLRSTNWVSGASALPPLYRGPLVTLCFNAAIDPTTVSQAVHTVPPADVLATQSQYNREYVEVSILGGLVPSTQYQLQIDVTLRDSNGNGLAQSKSLPFSTDSFRVTSVQFSGSQYGGQLDPGGELYAYVNVNAAVDVSAFNGATTFAPAIPGVWFVRSSGDSSQGTLEFFPTGQLNLLPEQTYVLRISGTAPLAGGAALGADFMGSFTVQPVKVTRLYPENGSRGVGTYNEISIYFNTPMNQASTESAFRLGLQGGGAVSGVFSWSSDQRYFSFRPSAYLEAAKTYVVSISTLARSQSGQTLKTAGSSVFRTQ